MNELQNLDPEWIFLLVVAVIAIAIVLLPNRRP